jgi:hypothetical protein
MNNRMKKLAIAGLRWSVGLVVLLEALHFVLSGSAMEAFSRSGFPHWIRPGLGWSEVLAALLFLIPGSRIVGGYALLAILAAAIAIHFGHGEFGVGSLIVYGMAVVVCMAHSESKAEVKNE